MPKLDKSDEAAPPVRVVFTVANLRDSLPTAEVLLKTDNIFGKKG